MTLMVYMPYATQVLTPVCNAATYVDRHLFGVDHMYFPANGGDTTGNDMTFQRMPECSTCSPGKCWNHSDPTEGGGPEGGPEGGPVMPAWCNEAPFDPEGSVSTLNAILSTIIGCHFGHVFVQIKGHAARLYHMVIFSVVQVVLGLLLHFSNVIRMNTDLYSFSYVLVSGGAGGIALSICYCIVDCKKVWAAGWRPVATCSLFPIHFVLGNSRTLLGCSVPCVCLYV